MNIYKKLSSSILATAAIVLGFAAKTYAICPVCTIAVAAGVGLSRYLGVDDTITGLWVGAILVTAVFWTITWFEKKQWHFKGRDVLTWVAYYALVLIPLVYSDMIGHPANKLWGIDKLLLGTALGSVFFYLGDQAYPIVKERNGGKAHFPFEKVAFPIVPIVVLSIIFYFITR